MAEGSVTSPEVRGEAKAIGKGIYGAVKKSRSKNPKNPANMNRKEAARAGLRSRGLLEPSRAVAGGERLVRRPGGKPKVAKAADILASGSKRRKASIIRKARKQGAAKR